LEEISEGPHLKDDPTFALTAISPHVVTMLNKINKSSCVGCNFE
jgi:hypothetical protein